MGWGNRLWLPEEDELIRQAARANYELSIKAGDVGRPRRGFANRLQDVAAKTGRSYAAVRKRAERIGATSYRPRR